MQTPVRSVKEGPGSETRDRGRKGRVAGGCDVAVEVGRASIGDSQSRGAFVGRSGREGGRGGAGRMGMAFFVSVCAIRGNWQRRDFVLHM